MRLPVSLIELLRASPGMIMAGQAITETMSDRDGYRSLQYGAPVYESGVDILLQQQLSNLRAIVGVTFLRVLVIAETVKRSECEFCANPALHNLMLAFSLANWALATPITTATTT